MKLLISFFLLSIISCSASNITNKELILENAEAWYDLMPSINRNNRNFKFRIEFKIPGNFQISDTSLITIKNFKLYFNNKTSNSDFLLLRKYYKDRINIILTENSDKTYFNGLMPDSALFSFKVNYSGSEIGFINTRYIKIQKIY